MTTVVQTTYPQQPGYPPQQGGYSTQQATTYIQVPPPISSITAATTTTTTGSSTPGISQKYNKKAGLITGILQIVAGAVLIVIGVVLLAIGTWISIGWNIWGSICFYIVTGILGVISKNQNRCVIIAYMVMCIISAVCAGSQTIFDSVAASISSHMHGEYCGYQSYSFGYGYHGCSRQKAIVAMHALSALIAFGEMIIAIVGSAYSCSGVCGSSTPSQTMVVTYAQPATTGQMTVVNPGPYPGHAVAPQPVVYPQPPAYSQQMQPGMPPPGMQQPAMQPLPQQPEHPATYEEPK